MKTSALVTISLATAAQSALAFYTPTALHRRVASSSLGSTPAAPEDIQPEQQNKKESAPAEHKNSISVQTSQALPWMDCPAVLKDCTWAGNAGFDPLNLSTNVPQLRNYREAEIKHARLAMLAAAGLPLSGLFDHEVDAFFGVKFLESDAWHTMILNRIAPVFWGACLGLVASLEMYEAAVAERDHETPPGQQLHFDPMHLYPSDAAGQKRVCNLEIQHGRVAMLAMAVYLLQEYNFMTPGSTTIWDALWQALEEW